MGFVATFSYYVEDETSRSIEFLVLEDGIQFFFNQEINQAVYDLKLDFETAQEFVKNLTEAIKEEKQNGKG